MFKFYGFYLGPGQSIEQAIAQPVIRMQPVMQQTNVCLLYTSDAADE